MPKSETVASIFGGAHWVLTKVLALSLLLHIAGALKHHVIDKDATLRRMWFGASAAPETTGSHKHSAPIAAALAFWAAALSVGAALGAYAPYTTPGTAIALEEVQSDWQVQEGTLSIEVTQLGSEVTGTFADWTAAINFDEMVDNGPAGQVEVTIAIGSLTLGSVTSQAMGPDFFNAQDFPTATFTADIISVVDGYEAQGTVTIKDQSMPLTLPFGLSVTEEGAWMTGNATLDRRDFGIGDNMADETSLKFAVEVKVELMATRATPPE